MSLLYLCDMGLLGSEPNPFFAMVLIRQFRSREVLNQRRDSPRLGYRGHSPLGRPRRLPQERPCCSRMKGGPAILEIEVPESLADLADIGGEVRFDRDVGLKELLAIWTAIPKRIL